MKRLALLPILLLLPGCGMISSITQGVQETRQLISDNRENIANGITMVKEGIAFIKGIMDNLRPLTEKLDLQRISELISKMDQMKLDIEQGMKDLKAANEQAFVAADKNGDGKLTGGELLSYLLAGGSAALTALVALLGKLKNATMQGQHDEAWETIAELQKQLAVLQAQQKS